jgi:RND family efflux transporter MFP subunit
MRTRMLLLPLSLLALAGCKRDQPPPPPMKAPEVVVAVPVTRKVTDYEYFTGRTEASERVDLKARVTGHLMKAPFREGAMVKEGDLLFEVDAKPFEVKLTEAKAAHAQARARYERTDTDYQRARSLYDRQAIGKEEYDRIVGDYKEALAAVDVAASQIDTAKQNLEYTKLKAPFSGRMSRRYIDPGNLVKADETVLSTLVNDKPMYAMFDVDERTMLRRLFKTGALETARQEKVSIRLGLSDEEGQFPHEGVVNFIDNKVDPNTGTMWMRGEFTKVDRPLTPGLFVRVQFPLGKPYDAVLIADQAVGTDQGQKFVYVVNEENKVEYRPVELGRLDEGLRVVRKGLKAGEKIVVSGLQRVRPKAEVVPKVVEMPNRTSKSGAPKDDQ